MAGNCGVSFAGVAIRFDSDDKDIAESPSNTRYTLRTCFVHCCFDALYPQWDMGEEIRRFVVLRSAVPPINYHRERMRSEIELWSRLI